MISGRYSLEREIGRGATGTVWLGRDEVLGRNVALKRIGLLPGTDQTDLARAEREAQLSARLAHPHVLGVYDAVVDGESESHWLVMEYVDGADLGRLVRDRGPLTPDQAAPLLAQAADALAAAHAAGIVHRDVKPSNILLDRAGQVKIADFGIARLASDATLTQTGFVLGSPAYLAPEVAAGGRADEAADVWSLGATLVHVLTGRPPYEIGDNVVGGLYKIVHEDPPRPPEAGWLAPLLEATMVRDPAQRWSMSQVHAYLASSGDVQGPLPVAAAAPAPDGTRVIAPTPAPATSPDPALASLTSIGSIAVPLILLAAALVVVLAGVAAFALLHNGSSNDQASGSGDKATHAAKKQSAGPTKAGMESFIRSYVSTVSDDPAKSWTMLSPKFQEQSGGYSKYHHFWDRASNGQVLSISADPANLSVAYQVHFDDFKNGPGPTVLDLTYSDGRVPDRRRADARVQAFGLSRPIRSRGEHANVAGGSCGSFIRRTDHIRMSGRAGGCEPSSDQVEQSPEAMQGEAGAGADGRGGVQLVEHGCPHAGPVGVAGQRRLGDRALGLEGAGHRLAHAQQRPPVAGRPGAAGRQHHVVLEALDERRHRPERRSDERRGTRPDERTGDGEGGHAHTQQARGAGALGQQPWSRR